MYIHTIDPVLDEIVLSNFDYSIVEMLVQNENDDNLYKKSITQILNSKQKSSK